VPLRLISQFRNIADVVFESPIPVGGVSTIVIGIVVGLGSVIVRGVSLGVAGMLVLGPRLVLGFVSLRVVDRRLSLCGRLLDAFRSVP
jgi:hypothetical protein